MQLRVPLLPRWLRWSGVLVIAGFIFYVSIVTVPPETVVDQVKPGPPDLIQLDKWRHFVAYAGLGYALAYATTDRELDTRILAVLVILTTMIYGVGIEYGQSLIPERYFSLADAYANALGGFLVIPWYLIQQYFDFVPFWQFVKASLNKSNES